MSNGPKAKTWTPDQRTLLDALLDTIIPPGADLPGAGALGIADFLAEQIAETPELRENLTQGLRKTAAFMKDHDIPDFPALPPEERETTARQLEAAEPAFFTALITYTYIGYYTHPTVPPHFGFPNHPPQPEGNDLPPDDPDELDRILEPVRKRGPIYREC